MTNITKLIVAALHENWPDYEIYTESIEQGFREPCFSIAQIEGKSEAYPSGRTYIRQHFDVQFFQNGVRPREQCRDMAEKLVFQLHELPGVRGTDIEWEITDNVLHFFVTYARFVQTSEKDESMKTLDQTQGVKNE